MKLFMVDGIGPFFRGYARHRINWSKIPFDNMEFGGEFDAGRFAGIREDFIRFADAVAELGFNGITLDDLAHLSLHSGYSDRLASKVRRYRDAYAGLFEIAAARGLTPYVTTDVMFAPSGHPELWGDLRRDGMLFLRDACESLFKDFPLVGGVIFRMGECDGRDVRGDFTSRLAIRTPSQARDFLRELLPVFERNRRRLIFRTWTVGAYMIGDLIWNRHTFDRTFAGIDSPSLVLSMKYGETDFFRHLPLNPLFFRSDHKKIIELQARREYEGFGEYPSHVGPHYEEYVRQLEGARNMVGAWIWCQTGGWSGFRRRAFLEPAGVWIELNTVISLRLVRDRQSADMTIRQWAESKLGPDTAERLGALLRFSDEVIQDGLYIEEFARHKLFFRRLRVPPLLHVYWDMIHVNAALRRILRCFVRDSSAVLRRSGAALDKIRVMRALALELGLPAGDFDFQYDTFLMLREARAFYFGPADPERVHRLYAMRTEYERRYPLHYHLRLNPSAAGVHHYPWRLIMALLFRSQRGYRRLDRWLLIRVLTLLSPWLARDGKGGGHRMGDQAMGIRAVLR